MEENSFKKLYQSLPLVCCYSSITLMFQAKCNIALTLQLIGIRYSNNDVDIKVGGTRKFTFNGLPVLVSEIWSVFEIWSASDMNLKFCQVIGYDKSICVWKKNHHFPIFVFVCVLFDKLMKLHLQQINTLLFHFLYLI